MRIFYLSQLLGDTVDSKTIHLLFCLGPGEISLVFSLVSLLMRGMAYLATDQRAFAGVEAANNYMRIYI